MMAVFFPRGQQAIKKIKRKFLAELERYRASGAEGIAFVTNQELRLAERKELADSAQDPDQGRVRRERR